MTASSVTATTVLVTWRQPIESFTPDSYMIVLTRVIGAGQVLCPDVQDSRSVEITQKNIFTMQFTGLHEFSSYEVRITASFSAFGARTSEPGSIVFTTSAAGMCS